MNIGDISISEIVAQTKYLELTARRLVNDSLQSDYKSSFRGRGMEFDEVRSYFPGDNVRDIDWNVTARMGEPFIKTFIEERELTTYFIVDISHSGEFGQVFSKRKKMAEITALLGFTAFFANDKTGLILGTDSIEKIVPPSHNYSNILRIIRDVYYYQGESQKTNLATIFSSARMMIKKKSVIFIISDFFDKGYEHALGTLAKKHEVIPIVVRDNLDINLSAPGSFPVMVELEDMESGQNTFVTLNSNNALSTDSYTQTYRRLFKQLALNHAEITPDSDLVRTIDSLLRKHSR